MRSVLFVVFFLFCVKTFACSAFMCKAKNGVYFAKNFDWQYSHGYVLKNNRGVEKYAYNFKGVQVPSWTSKYGSITFNQIGKEFPFGGMNEKGLVVEQLWNFDNCEYEIFKNKAAISELEWIQYQLDNYKSVAEVIENTKQLSIVPVMATIHYFIADTLGNSAIIEFINGKTKIIENSSNHQLITNSSYENSEAYWHTHNTNVDKTSATSLNRYCHLNKSVSELNLDEAITKNIIFKTLLSTKTNITQWTIVYSATDRSISFLSRDFKAPKTVHFKDLNFEDDTILASKINSEDLDFKPYKTSQNEALLNTFKENFGIDYLDYTQMSTHQMQPDTNRSDILFKETITVKIDFDVKVNSGRIGVMLVNGETNYKKRKPLKASMLNVKNNNASAVIYAVPKGEYAIMAYHDINNNGKLDTNFLGIPKEPYAFSNNAKGFLGLPASYKKAKFKINSDTDITLNIK